MHSKTIIIFGIIVSVLGLLLIWIVYYFWKVRNRPDFDYRARAKLPQDVQEQRRKHLRTDVQWPVSLETSNGTMQAEARNISMGGAFICCNDPLPVGTIFGLTLVIQDEEPLAATAKVVWSNVNVPIERVVNLGMGIRFIQMSDRHIQLVRHLFQ